jgi:hypothetical protein
VSYKSCCGVDEKSQHAEDCPKQLEIKAYEMTEEKLGPFVLWHENAQYWIKTKQGFLEKLKEKK